MAVICDSTFETTNIHLRKKGVKGPATYHLICTLS